MSNIRNAVDIVEDVERRIGAGLLNPGDRLAPVRAMASDLGVSATTVGSAYRMLRERGVTVGRGRAGTFVARRPPLGGPIAAPVPRGVVDLSNGLPDPALLPDIGAALRAVSYGPASYTTPPVDEALAHVFRSDLSADGVDATYLAVVGGALDGIERVLQAHLRPGDAVAVEDPAYVSVRDLLAAMGLREVAVAVDARGPLPDALDEALGGGCAAAILTPRAHNPTGAAIDATRAVAIARVFDEHPSVLVIEDDHAGRVAGAAHHPVVRPDMRRWAVVRSVSKSLGPDLRLAVIAGDDVTIQRVRGRQSAGTGWVSHVLQALVVELRSANEALLQEAERRYTGRRTLFVDTLRRLGIETVAPSGLNVWVPVLDETAVVTAMMNRGWAIRGGSRFRIHAPPGVRVTVAASSDQEIVDVAGALAGVVGSREARRTA